MTCCMSSLGCVQCHSLYKLQEITSADDSIKGHSRNKGVLKNQCNWSTDAQSISQVRFHLSSSSPMQGIPVFPVMSGGFSFLWLKLRLVIYDLRVVAIKQALWPRP